MSSKSENKIKKDTKKCPPGCTCRKHLKKHQKRRIDLKSVDRLIIHNTRVSITEVLLQQDKVQTQLLDELRTMYAYEDFYIQQIQNLTKRVYKKEQQKKMIKTLEELKKKHLLLLNEIESTFNEVDD